MDGSGAGSGVGYDLPETLRQMTQLRIIDLINCLAAGIQNDCRRAVSVAPVPEWHSVVCMSRTISEDRGCLDGRRYGNFVTSLSGALWMRPPHRRYPL